MTDGFAFSAASTFMKNAYKSGAAIIIGYNGNPNLPDDIFDISQSASGVFGMNSYKDIYPEIYNNIVKYKMGLNSITCIASYHEFQESHIPQEYDVQIADKRTKLFNPYDDSSYQDFINEAIDGLKWYQENCNPKHEMLVLFSDECKFDISHMHGGFRCGKDSKWNKTDCIPVYCDSGYFYNKISNSCIKYPMENNNDKTWIIIVSVVCGVIVLAIIIILIILYKKKALCFKKSSAKNESIANENLVPETSFNI